MIADRILIVIILGFALFGMLATFLIMFVISYHKTQRQFKLEKEALEREFQSALFKAQLEITEQTLQSVAQEIHDNIGHQLVFASMNLNQEEGLSERVQTSLDIIEQAISDLRNLSKSLSGNYILERGLEMALEREALMVQSAAKMSCVFTSSLNTFCLNEQQEIIVFRCAQEAINNAVKHSQASNLHISLSDEPGKIRLIITDNGKGFETNKAQKGLGLSGSAYRMKLLGGHYEIHSGPGSGTRVILELPCSIVNN